MTSEITIKLIDPMATFEEAIPLLEANWKESGNPFDFNAADTKSFYTYMADLHLLFAAGVYSDEKLVGYCVVSFVPHPLNHSIKICNVDGIYLIPELRGGNVFDRLRATIKELALEHKIHLIHWHAPAGSDFSNTLALRYEPISNYFREQLIQLPLSIPAMSQESIEQARKVETALSTLPQVEITTDHVLHAGVYTRTIFIPKDVVITGALVKRSVNLIISGHVIVYFGEGKGQEYIGHIVLTASAHRKQVFIAKEDTYLTMFFATQAKTIEEAECEFTDEVDLLVSRKGNNNVVITGE